MNQNNAAQPSIDLALQMLGPLACLVQPPGSGSSQGFTIPCATVREVLEPVIEMLSNLRAPVADERALHIKALQDLRLGVEMDQHYMDDGDAKLAALDAAITALRWSAGALQALNIEADKITLDGETRTVGDILDHADRALASAPVAGEAQPVVWEDVRDALAMFLSGATGKASRHWIAPLEDATASGPLAKMRACLAAPQASDAVQGTEHMAPGLGDVVLPRLPPITHKWAALISDSMARALENWARAYTRTAILADRQQRARDADEYEKMRDVLQWIVDDAASGGMAKLRPQQEKRARAALSVQPGAQRTGGSDAE